MERLLLAVIALGIVAVAVVLHRISNILLLWREFDIEERRKQNGPDGNPGLL